MSHALLLRLFLSPYFSISVAMHYLKTYPDSIGISHYLCWRMRGMPAEEVEFYWPQICHLLITYPTQSNALEAFVLDRAEESTHSAMLTFWFMQAALRDLTPSRQTNPRPFHICQRLLHRCHEIIFGDPPEPSRSPYRSLPHSPPNSTAALHASSTMQSLLRGPGAGDEGGARKPPVRVNEHIGSALVGMGVMLASAPGMRGLDGLAGKWAITQGRRPRGEDGEEGRKRVEVDQGGGADVHPERQVQRRVTGGRDQPKLSEDASSDEGDDEHVKRSAQDMTRAGSVGNTAQARLRSSPNLHPSLTAPNLYSPPTNTSSTQLPNMTGSYPSPSPSLSQKGVDPFSQLPASTSTPSPRLHHAGPSRSGTPPSHTLPHQPFYSVPELAQSRSHARFRPTDRPPPPEALLATYSLEAQRQLLRSHYCRSEVRFLLVLEDISNRLLVVPKPARVSALRAELTSLNHNLPAEVCMPLWCAADHSHEEGGETSSSAATPLKLRPDRPSKARKKAHSRVVRISPGDSVVLNSAERAPFLLHVEVLEGDLDFDPIKRENRELLKRIVVQEDAKKRKREHGGADGQPTTLGGEGFGAPMPDVLPVLPEPHQPEEGKQARRVRVLDADAARVAKEDKAEEPEEMDLVEQLYGAQLSVRDVLPDLSESVPLKTAPKNKATDLAAWDRSEAPSRRGSIAPGTPGPVSAPHAGVDGLLTASPSASGLDTPGGMPSPGLGPALPGSGEIAGHGGGGHGMTPKRTITLEDYSERMRTAAVMLAQLNASLVPAVPEGHAAQGGAAAGAGGKLSWIPGTGWITGSGPSAVAPQQQEGANQAHGGKLRLAAAQAEAIRQRIMEEMMALEEERVERMTERPEGAEVKTMGQGEEGGGAGGGEGRVEDEGIVRRELNKADPSAAVFRESWTAKKSRIRAASPWGHLANWDVISVIVKTGTDLRQEQLATQLIERFSRIWKDEKCDCWVRFFRILITGETSGLVETITDAVSVHSIKKGEYARRIAEGGPIGHVSLMDHYVNTYGKPDTGRFARAQRNFIKSLAGYSIVTYLLQIKDRHNGNILVDRDGHLIHIDFGFMLSNSPGGNMGFEAAPFKMPMEYVDIMGGLDSPGYVYFKKLFKEGFEAARKHSDSLITIVELMQKDSKLDCFILFGDQTAHHLRERFALGLTTAAVDAYLERLIVSSTGSNYTRLYDTFQYYSQGVL